MRLIDSTDHTIGVLDNLFNGIHGIQMFIVSMYLAF